MASNHGKHYNRLRPSDSQTPRIHGRPKIHKESVPLRPILSCIAPISYIAYIISHVVGKIAPIF